MLPGRDTNDRDAEAYGVSAVREAVLFTVPGSKPNK
jgi:hypothetical protein